MAGTTTQRALRHGSATAEVPRVRPLGGRAGAALIVAAAVGWAGWRAVAGQGALVNGGGWAQLARFLEAAARPELSPAFLQLTAEATVTTLAFAVAGMALSLPIGMVGGLLGAEVLWASIWPAHRDARLPLFRAPWLVARVVLAAPRAVHEYIWALLFVATIGLDPLTAVLAVALPYGAIEAKVFSEILDETPRQPLGALRAAGVAPVTALLYGLLPRAMPDLVSYAFYRLECAVRAATVLGLIGAGGLGYQIQLSLQSLRYDEIWTLFAALVVLNGAMDLWSARLRRRLGGANRLDIKARRVGRTSRRASGPPDSTASGVAPSDAMAAGLTPSGPHGAGATDARRRDPLVRRSLVAAVVLVALAFLYLQPDVGLLVSERTATLVADVAAQALPPDLTAVAPHTLLDLTLNTLAMSVLAGAGATALGLVLALPAAGALWAPGGPLGPPADGRPSARQIVVRLGVGLTRLLLLAMRAVPAPVWALLLLFVLFPGVLPDAVALAVYTAGILGRLMAEAFEHADPRPARALRAAGAGRGATVLYALLPRTLPRAAAYALYRWEVCVRETVVVGLVGAGGLGLLLTEQLTSFDYDAVAATLLVFFGLVLGADLASAALRRVLR